MKINDSNKTYHLITDTSHGLKCFDKHLNSAFYLNNGRTIVPVSDEEKEVFNLIAERLHKKKYAYNFESKDFSKMIGWIKIN